MLAVIRRRAAFAVPALVALTMLFPVSSRAATQVSIPVVGTVSVGGTLTDAVFTLTSFGVQNGQVVANGTFSGVLTTADGAASSVLTSVAMPVNVTQATCSILHLDLGPLSLNLLGLQVDLSRIVLDITAVSGPGNLLGNLLCAVAGLLDNPSGLSQLLNRILGAL